MSISSQENSRIPGQQTLLGRFPESVRILIIRFGSLGDVVKTTALPRQIKKSYPMAWVGLLTSIRYRHLVDKHPCLDWVCGFDRETGLMGLFKLVKELKRLEIDVIVDVHKSLRSRVLTSLMRAQTVPYTKRTLQRFLLIQFGWNTYSGTLGKEHDFLAGLAPHGVRNDGEGTLIGLDGVGRKLSSTPATSEILQWIRTREEKAMPLLGLAPMAAWKLKQWPINHFRRLAELYIKATGGAVVVFGGSDDVEARALARSIGDECLDVVGKTSLLQSAYMAAQVTVLVANDSGMAHITEAVGKDVIVLYGPTSRELGYYPTRPGSIAMEAKLRCRPCSKMGNNRCYHPREKHCLESITPEMVLERILERLEHPGFYEIQRGRDSG